MINDEVTSFPGSAWERTVREAPPPEVQHLHDSACSCKDRKYETMRNQKRHRRISLPIVDCDFRIHQPQEGGAREL
jgi:hypothetical protein